jgi:hypothetical protein
MVLGAAWACSSVWLSACSSLGGPPVVRLGEQEIEAWLRRSFPLQRRVLEVFEASVALPRLRLLPLVNRLAADVQLTLQDRVLGGRWQGRLDFDAALRWEAADQTLRLNQVRVRDFSLQAGGAAPRTGAERLGAALAERVLEDLQLYRRPAERAAELQRRGLTPGTIIVQEQAVEIRFMPSAR